MPCPHLLRFSAILPAVRVKARTGGDYISGRVIVDRPERIAVFLDYQNIYSRGRDAFCNRLDPAVCGQVHPFRLAELISSRGRNPRQLVQVRVYRGRPDATRDPQGYGANVRQCAVWERTPLTKVITRQLRYPLNWPHQRPEEKGIDVALAIDFVTMAVRGEYDCGVIMSTDTDLKPALEAVLEMGRGRTYPRCELAAWSLPDQHARRLSVPGRRIWCHWLDRADYESVADRTDYNIPDAHSGQIGGR